VIGSGAPEGGSTWSGGGGFSFSVSWRWASRMGRVAGAAAATHYLVGSVGCTLGCSPHWPPAGLRSPPLTAMPLKRCRRNLPLPRSIFGWPSSRPASKCHLGTPCLPCSNWRMSPPCFHYSSAPHHRRFEMAITNGLGGIGFKSMVMRGAITAGCKTVGDRKAYHRRFSNRW